MEFHGTARVSEIGALHIPWNSMELLMSAKLAHFKFHGIPWNSMELLVSAKLAHYKFHGIPWNCSCQRNWRTQSSMEFRGTARVIEIGALLVPGNSMELLVSAKLAHSKFHGILWNCSCQRNLSTQSSMEFHGTSHVSEIGALQIPWNSMELLVSAKLAHSKFHGIPWNSMEPLVPAKLAHPKFHGIPWIYSCHRNWRTPSSMEFQWIPWNCSCQRNWRILSSMEFHGTARVSEIGAFQVPWNSMELLVSAKLAHF